MSFVTKLGHLGCVAALALVGCAQGMPGANEDSLDLSPEGRADSSRPRKLVIEERGGIGEAVVACRGDSDCSVDLSATWRSVDDPGWNELTRELARPGSDEIYGSWTRLFPLFRVEAIGYGFTEAGESTEIACPAQIAYAAVHHEGNRDAGAKFVFVDEGVSAEELADDAAVQSLDRSFSCTFDSTTIAVNYKLTRIDSESYGLGQLTLGLSTSWR